MPFSTTEDNPFPQAQATTYFGSLDASWEIDLFGRVRRLNESARADAQAGQADFESVRLPPSADVGVPPLFALRALDQEQGWLADGIHRRRRELDLVGAQRRRGAATDFDLARAETELATTQAEAAATANRREGSSSPATLSPCWRVRRHRTSRSPPSSPCHSSRSRKYPPDCPATCSSAGPTWPPRSALSSPPTPASGSRRPPSSPRSA